MDTEVAVVVSGVVAEVAATAALLDTSMSAMMPADAGATSTGHLNTFMLLFLITLCQTVPEFTQSSFLQE